MMIYSRQYIIDEKHYRDNSSRSKVSDVLTFTRIFVLMKRVDGSRGLYTYLPDFPVAFPTRKALWRYILTKPLAATRNSEASVPLERSESTKDL